MNKKSVYLKPNIQIEPMINQWYAVSLLIPPATCAMYVANHHLKIMKSYILSPQMHAAANQDPAMMGGPFVNYKENRVPEIKSLLEKTLDENSYRLEFAEAVKALDQSLKKEGTGYSLEPLYEKVPEILKGVVELNYDLNNNPSFRFIEKLLYLSPLHDLTSQSIGLSLITQDNRPFVLSTPRIENQGRLNLKIPFNHPGLDVLFKMRQYPIVCGKIKEILGIEDKRDELLHSFLSENGPAPKSQRKYDGDGVRVRYYGHACLLVETRNVSILTDPFVSYDYATDLPRYTFQDLPESLDYIVITHGHLDHLVIETLLQLRHKTKTIVVPRNGGGGLADPSLKLLLTSIGYQNVLEIDEFESIEVEGGSITGAPFVGEHHDLNVRGKTTYLITLEGKTIFIAADYCNLETKICEYVRRTYGDIDVLFLGMECDGAPVSWFYGPFLTKKLDREMDYSRRGSASDKKRGLDMVNKLNCKRAYVYAMGQEPWLSYILSINAGEDSLRMAETRRFLADCNEQGIEAELLFGQKSIQL